MQVAWWKMVKKQDIIQTIGKRKMSLARAILRPGKGIVRINSRLLSTIMPEMARERIKEPLFLAPEIADKVNIKVIVRGGGWNSQAEAVRLAIARALIEHSSNPELKERFNIYDKYLLVADTRRTEPHKCYRSAARSQRQTSKR